MDKIFIGTWALGDEYWGEQSHSDSIKTIHAAIREGFKSFDTAPVYGKGRSEQLLGQQLKGDTSYILSSKSFIKPASSIIKSLNNSLKRLQRDYIDYFFIHWPSTKDDCRPIVEQLEKLRHEGKIKKIGVSNFNQVELDIACEAGNIDIIQNAYNFFWPFDDELFKYCHSKNIKTQAYSPLAQGLLTGKFSNKNPYIKNDKRHLMTLFSDNNIEIIYNYIDKLSIIAEQNNISLYQLIIKWMESRENIDSIIVGCRKREQVEMLKSTKDITIDVEVINTVSELSVLVSKEIVRGNNIFNHSY